MNVKKCVLIICSLSCFSQIDAGLRDQWVWFKSLFYGFSIKKPTVTRRQMVIGGVGALAVAGAAWWWLKSPKNPKKPKTQDSSSKLVLDQKKPTSSLQLRLGALKNIDLTKIKSDDYVIVKNNKECASILIAKYLSHELINNEDYVKISTGFNKEKTVLKSAVFMPEIEDKTNTPENLNDNISSLELKLGELNSLDTRILKEGNYVFVDHTLDNDKKVILIGKYVSYLNCYVTVLTGSPLHNIELEQREYKSLDVFMSNALYY